MTKFATAVGTTAQILGDDGANPAGPGNPLTVSLEVKGVTHVDRSGTITAGGTAQTLAAANTSRKGMWLQNQSTGDLWLRWDGTAAATQPSLKVPAGALYEFPSSGVPMTAVSVFGATTGQTFAAREW